MRALVLTGQWFPDYAGGTARVVRATAEGLVRNGHEVVVIAPRSPHGAGISDVNGVQLHRVIRRSALPLTITDIYEIRRVLRALGPGRFDAILAHGEICAAGVLSMRRRPPVSLIFHASGPRETRYRRASGLSLRERARSLALQPLLGALERITLRHADRILVLSEFSRRLVIESAKDTEPRIEVVGGGVDTRVFAPAPDRDALRERLGIAPDQRVLMTARRLVSRMGIELLLDAFSLVRPGEEDIQLVIAGDGELRPRLEAQRDRLNLNGSVRFLGRICDEDLRDWYRAADLFVLPTLAYEGFGMATAEALACGTPVVGTDVGATREILGGLDDSLLARELDARSLASTVERVLADTGPELRSRCSAYAKASLGWDHVLTRWEAALSHPTATPATSAAARPTASRKSSPATGQ